MEEKIMSANANGDLQFDDRELMNDYVKDEEQKIVQCKNINEQRVQWLRLAQLCERNGDERGSADFYSRVLWGVVQITKGTEEYDICKQAYAALANLHGSKDEYVWETASEALTEARDLFIEKE